MLFSKLPIVFLSAIASEKNGSTNSTIATYILSHLDEMKYIGITEFANKCNVSNSSISRFCKEIGLENFSELKSIISSIEFHEDEEIKSDNYSDRMMNYAQSITNSILQVSSSLSEELMKELLVDIHRFKKIATFGLMKAETAALILQSDLLNYKKNIYTNLSYKEQMEFIEESSDDTLIIIFTYTGSYFKYNDRRNYMNKKNIPKIWMISGENEDEPHYVYKKITFSSPQDYISHPYQLDFVATTLAQEYGYYLSKTNKKDEPKL